MTMLIPILLWALPLAASALELNAVDPDTVLTGASPSTASCASAHLLDADSGECTPDATCATQYFLTDVKELETEVSLSWLKLLM